MRKNELVEYESTIKNGKSEIGQILKDERKWKNGINIEVVFNIHK